MTYSDKMIGELMPGCGNICFFTETELPEPVQLVRRVLEFCSAECVASAQRTLVADQGWEVFQHSIDAAFVPVQTIDDDVPTEDFLEPMTLESAAELYSSSGTLHLTIGRNRIGPNLYKGIQLVIPGSVAGEFAPSSPVIRIGWHDVFEMCEQERGTFFGRAFFSFSLFGSGTPMDWEKYRQVIFEVPAVLAFKTELEAITGILQNCIYWDI